MKYSTLALSAILATALARPEANTNTRLHPRDVQRRSYMRPVYNARLGRREVPQELSHKKFLTTVQNFLQLDNPNNIVDPFFGLLDNAAASQGQGLIADTDCLQQATADQAFTNAKAVGDIDGMTAALIYRALERNTALVGLASVPCTSIEAVNPEIAAIQQHQDPASENAGEINSNIAINLGVQIAFIGGDPTEAIQSGTFAPGDVNDPTGAGNTCNFADDEEGCIFTQNLLVEDVSVDDILAAVANAGINVAPELANDVATATAAIPSIAIPAECSAFLPPDLATATFGEANVLVSPTPAPEGVDKGKDEEQKKKDEEQKKKDEEEKKKKEEEDKKKKEEEDKKKKEEEDKKKQEEEDKKKQEEEDKKKQEEEDKKNDDSDNDDDDDEVNVNVEVEIDFGSCPNPSIEFSTEVDVSSGNSGYSAYDKSTFPYGTSPSISDIATQICTKLEVECGANEVAVQTCIKASEDAVEVSVEIDAENEGKKDDDDDDDEVEVDVEVEVEVEDEEEKKKKDDEKKKEKGQKVAASFNAALGF